MIAIGSFSSSAQIVEELEDRRSLSERCLGAVRRSEVRVDLPEGPQAPGQDGECRKLAREGDGLGGSHTRDGVAPMVPMQQRVRCERLALRRAPVAQRHHRIVDGLTRRREVASLPRVIEQFQKDPDPSLGLSRIQTVDRLATRGHRPVQVSC